MLTTAILLLVAAQELDTSFCGVWATRQDEVFVMHEPGKATFQTLNKFGWLPEMSKAPDGNYFGHWYTAERLTILIDSSRAAEGAQVLDNPATAPTGEAYLRFGLRDSRGITSTIVIAMRDKFKNQKFGGELRYVMPLTHLTVQGTYQNGPLTATIEDRPGKDSMLGGTLTALGRTMFIKGKRRGARAGF